MLQISPSSLLTLVRERFRKLGGVILNDTILDGVTVSDTVGVAIDLGKTNEPITTHLLVDCLGSRSKMTRHQHEIKPDGICAVVGSYATGYDQASGTIRNVAYSMKPDKGNFASNKFQYFSETTLGQSHLDNDANMGKVTYMFTYMNSDEERPSLESLLEDYWRMLPMYQSSVGNPETDLDVEKVMFSFFPTYAESTLQPRCNRFLKVGESSGMPTPLSFDKVSTFSRNLHWIVTAVDEAFDKRQFDREFLGEFYSYALLHPSRSLHIYIYNRHVPTM
jgi:lycopene cyclase CruP